MKNINTPLLFVHIPKTGGSTFHNILNNQYDKIYNIDSFDVKESIRKFKEFDQNKIQEFGVIKGHLALQLLDHIKNPTTVTFLREPIDCFISTYHYIKRAKRNRNHSLVKNLTLYQFVDFAVENGIDNHQTRHLSNSLTENPSKESEKMAIYGEELLERAKVNLEKFDFVFYTTQFDKSVLILFKELNWKKKPFFMVENKTKNRPNFSDIPPETLEKIKEVQKFDISLFEYSKKINDGLMKKFSLEKELKFFRFQNFIFQKINTTIPHRILKRLTY